jgi:hypothetical protein
MKIRPPDIRNSRQMGIEHRAKPIRTMTKTKIELKNEPDAADLKFPPDGLFTAVAIAQELGIHPDSIRKRYYPEACEIWGIYSDCLKSGQLYTAIAYEEFFRMRQLRNADRLILNSSDRIVRQADGLPATEPNAQKMTKRQYRALRWEEQPELKPGYQPDSVEEANESGMAIVPKAYDVEVMDEFNSALDGVDAIGEGLGGFLDALKSSAEQCADVASATWAQTFSDRFGANMAQFQTQMGKSMTHKR